MVSDLPRFLTRTNLTGLSSIRIKCRVKAGRLGSLQIIMHCNASIEHLLNKISSKSFAQAVRSQWSDQQTKTDCQQTAAYIGEEQVRDVSQSHALLSARFSQYITAEP